MLKEHPALATGVIRDDKGAGRTLLHMATDWPGHFPNVAATIKMLADAGADPNAGLYDSPIDACETPLHWAASSDDVAAIDALLDNGADIEAPGAVFTWGTAMSDAVIFAQWHAARRLLARGAKTTLTQAAALGVDDRVRELCVERPTASGRDHGGALARVPRRSAVDGGVPARRRRRSELGRVHGLDAATGCRGQRQQRACRGPALTWRAPRRAALEGFALSRYAGLQART